MSLALRTLGAHAVVLDIEGTTTPVSFVYDVLFPYARANLRAYLTVHAEERAVREAARLLREEHAADESAGASPPALPGADPRWLTGYLEWLMDRDRKSTGLKLLQGLIWERGYADGTLRSEVFPDVEPALRRWRAAGMRIGVYSSGSVLAQRLIFAHTQTGDLTPLVDAYFDTTVGPKRASPSYRRIAASLALAPAQILFLSDVSAELDAAAEAGLATALVVRPGNAEQGEGSDVVIRSFEEIGV